MKKVGLIVFILFAAFVAIGYSLPKQVHVERSIIIERPADMLFAILNSYKHDNEWSPWAQRDPGAEFVVSGPESGVGARLSWIGEPHLVGSGWQEIVASRPYEQIDIKLDFLGKATYEAEIWEDAPESNDYPEKLVKKRKTFKRNDPVTLKLASGGGQILHLVSK